MNEQILKKIKSGREYRKMTLEVREVEDNQDYIVTGYATTFDQPYVLYHYDENKIVEEQVDRNAFDNTDRSDTIMQYDHEGRVFARVSNDTLKLSVDDHGLFIEAYLGGTEIGRNLYEEIKGGYTDKMSFGFTVTDDEFTETDKGYLRTIKSIGKLYDVSAVSLPANDYTEISARNQIDGEIEKIEAERLHLEEERKALAEKRGALEERLKALRKD
jgi:hypothetical protein